MKIVLICHYFNPEIGAPSARLSSLAKDFQALGHEVIVVTGFPNHPTGIIPAEYRGKWTATENLNGATVLRNWVYATPNEGILKKTLGHLSFMVTSVVLGGPRLGDVDVIIVSSPTFFSVISAWILSVTKGAPFVFEIRDLWPAVFVELGVLKNRWAIGILEWMELFLYRRSAAIVTVTETFKDILVRRGIFPGKITPITNGVNLDDFQPGEPDKTLADEIGAKGKFVVLYIGAHGISHALQAILRAAEKLTGKDDILFLFVGEGAERQKLIKSAQEWGIKNVRFLNGQPRDQVLKFYRTADICLVPLRNIPLFDTFIPSKMFEIMGCARPIVASVRGEAARILADSGAAVIVPPEDSTALAEAILSLKENPSLRQTMGNRGREFVMKHYQRRALAEKYLDVLERIAVPDK